MAIALNHQVPPDRVSGSLTEAETRRGLENIRRIRDDLCRRQLVPLWHQRQALACQLQQPNSLLRQVRFQIHLRQLDRRIRAIKQRLGIARELLV